MNKQQASMNDQLENVDSDSSPFCAKVISFHAYFIARINKAMVTFTSRKIVKQLTASFSNCIP